MIYFIQSIEYAMIMLEKIQYWHMHGFLGIIS
jgi:hypothetical protein